MASPSRKITRSLSMVALLPPSGGSCQSRGVSQDRNDVAPLRACRVLARCRCPRLRRAGRGRAPLRPRSEEHTSELQSLMRISYAVFCLKKTKDHMYDHKSQRTMLAKASPLTHNKQVTTTQ